MKTHVLYLFLLIWITGNSVVAQNGSEPSFTQPSDSSMKSLTQSSDSSRIQLPLQDSVTSIDSVMLEKVIGQMIMVGVKGTTSQQDPVLMEDLRAGKVGGVVLYEKNINPKNPINGFRTLIDLIKHTNTNIPVIISIDQEGGSVNRLKMKYGFPKSVTASALGSLDDTTTTLNYSRTTAKTLKDLGINVNFAPVLDLCKNKENPIIAKYGRCYSDDPNIVIKHASVMVQGHREHGIKTVVKHFPGHGSSRTDTHLGVADVTKYWSEEELIPFKDLIDSGKCDAVMTAHIVNQNWDTLGLPATLSYQVNQLILRDSLGFNGVIFSDDMQMKAISEQYGLKETIFLAIHSGVDVLMFSNNISGVNEKTVDQVHEIIHTLLSENRITKQRLFESYQRILEFKATL